MRDDCQMMASSVPYWQVENPSWNLLALKMLY
jgi:hypothetical protein